MLDYARSDTHYLLFIFENLLNALISRSSSSPPPSADGSSTPLPVSAFHPLNASQTPRLLQTVLARSAETCARRYSQEMYDVVLGSGPTGFRLLAKKWGKLPIVDSPSSSSPLAIEGAVYKAVHAWRDRVSREEDESTRWVLPNHQIFVLARQKPRTVRALLTCLQPITEVCRRRGDELVRIIGEGVEEAEGLAGSGGAAMDGAVEGVQAREEQEKAKRERERQEERDREGKKETIVADVWGAVAREFIFPFHPRFNAKDAIS
jgi:exosome complex exonuclease RRP6